MTLVPSLPEDDPVRLAGEDARQGFAPGITAPVEVILERDGIASELDGIATLQDELREQPGVATVVGPAEERGLIGQGVSTSEDGAAARIAVLLDHEPGSATAIDTVDTLEDRLPGLVADAGLGTRGADGAGGHGAGRGRRRPQRRDGAGRRHRRRRGRRPVADRARGARAQPPLPRDLHARAGRAALPPRGERAGLRGRPRAHRVRLPGAARLRRPHLLRAAGHGRAARVAGLGLQRLRRRTHLGGGAHAAAARGGRGGHAAGGGRDHRRGPDARGELRAARARPAPLVPRVRAADGHRRADRHAARALAAHPGPDLDLRREELVAGASDRPAAASRGARRRGRAPRRRRGGGRPGACGRRSPRSPSGSRGGRRRCCARSCRGRSGPRSPGWTATRSRSASTSSRPGSRGGKGPGRRRRSTTPARSWRRWTSSSTRRRWPPCAVSSARSTRRCSARPRRHGRFRRDEPVFRDDFLEGITPPAR